MEIKILRYVVTLAEELNFGRAAQRNFISAQPFGQYIQRAEREVGARLFERTSRRVVVTPTGHRFVDRARAVLAQLDGLREISADGPPVGDESLRLGIFGSGAGDRWADLRETVHAQAPGLALEYHELTFGEQYDVVRRGELDLAIVHYASDLDGLQFDTVLSTPRVAVVPASSAMADAEVLTLNELAEYRCLNVDIRELSVLEWIGFEIDRNSPVLRHPAGIPTAVAIAGGFCLHVATAEVHYPRPDVRFVPMEGPEMKMAVVTRSDDNRPAVTAFQRAVAMINEQTIT